MIDDAPNLNYLWAEILAEELARLDVGFVGLAPGSRSGPLALALGRHPRIRSHVHGDERGLAFLALGWGRATGRPAAVVTTSGTAAANLLPAVAEASQDRVPLLVMTADRPPELRDTGANQAMDQVKMFAPFVRWQVDVPCPDEAVPLRAWLTTIDQAVHRTLRAVPGPVHINIMLREPLAPRRQAYGRRRLLADAGGWLRGSTPFTTYGGARAVPEPSFVEQVAAVLGRARRGVLVAGELAAPDRAATARLADALGWPLLPDVRSGLRLGGESRTGIGLADVLLSSSRWSARHRADVVLHLGGRLTSKRVAEFVHRGDGPSIHVAAFPERQDPSHRVTLRGMADVAAFCSAVQAVLPARNQSAPWLSEWQQAEALAERGLVAAMARERALSEPRVAYELSRLLAPAHGLFMGNSLPIRLLEAFASPRGSAVPVAANRGVSGIDGVLATAVGWAAGLQRPATLLIGDLALLHDLNSLSLLAASRVPVTAIVLNNDGGGIFSFLPVASADRSFERLFGTPHGRTFREAARMFGLPYQAATTSAGLARAYRAAIRSGAPCVIEVRARRADTVRAYRRIQGAIVRALERRPTGA